LGLENIRLKRLKKNCENSREPKKAQYDFAGYEEEIISSKKNIRRVFLDIM